jgi:quercetin dioxygenase-like cupin family protein
MEDEKRSNPGELEPSQAVDLAGLLAVQPGAVVSRTLKKCGQGTLTIFAFDRDEGFSEHTAGFDAFVQVLSGRLRLVIGGQAVEAGPGQLVRMPAGVPHGLDALEPSTMLLTLIKG